MMLKLFRGFQTRCADPGSFRWQKNRTAALLVAAGLFFGFHSAASVEFSQISFNDACQQKKIYRRIIAGN